MNKPDGCTSFEDDQSLFLYYNAAGKDLEAVGANFTLGRAGQIIHGPALLVGLRGSVERDLTDRELEWISFTRPLPGALPILEIRGHDLAAPRVIEIELDDED